MEDLRSHYSLDTTAERHYGIPLRLPRLTQRVIRPVWHLILEDDQLVARFLEAPVRALQTGSA